MFDPDDFVEFSARHEHGLRGFEWNDLINEPTENLKERYIGKISVQLRNIKMRL